MDDWKAWIREIAYDRIDQIERHLNASPEAYPEFTPQLVSWMRPWTKRTPTLMQS